MKEHRVSVTENVEKSSPSDETLTRMKYGILNEINDAATRFQSVARVLFRCINVKEGF